MPAFNVASYIGEAIESILNQSYQNLELIIINDGSSDDTDAVIKSYVKCDRRIIYVSRENCGVALTRNEAIKLATGTWIALMDADDLSHPERLKEQWEYIQIHQVDACSTWIELFGFGGKRVKSYPILKEEIALEALFGCPIAHATLLAKKSIFLRFPYLTAWENAEDYEFIERAISANINIQCLPNVLYFYRQHPNQTSSSLSDKQQLLAQKVSLRSWQALGEQIGLNVEGIEEIVKLRSNVIQPLKLDMAEAVFDQLIFNKTDKSKLIFNNLLPLYFRAAYQYKDIANRWMKLCHRHQYPASKLTLLELYFVAKLKISPNNRVFIKLQNWYLKWAKKLEK